MTMPINTPPTETSANCPAASPKEKAPVSTAAMASL
jgi:hypothetical protein